MSPDRPVDFHFPKGGIDVSKAFARQSARPSADGRTAIYTTPFSENVRPYDFRGRFRGGSRPGAAKYIAGTALAGWIIQHLNVITGTYDDPSGESVQASQSGRVVTLVKVTQGNVYVASPGDTTWTSTTNNTGQSPPLNFTGIMFSAANNQRLYFADGANWVYYVPIANTVNTWTATAGDLPIDSAGNLPRLIETWRGRTILAGLIEDPQAWFMSRVQDPHDFEYFADADRDPAAAVSGNNGPLGLVGDVITGIIPFSDDTLIFLCDHSIWVMSGDPLAGGQLVQVSDAIGGAWGRAWCRGPDGTLFFFSNTCCIYAMKAGQVPVRVSQAIDPLIRDVNTGEYTVSMAWDDADQGFNLFISKTSEAADTRHFWWDARSMGWHPFRFENADHNPLVCCTVDGNRPNDRVTVFGSWDGYVRCFDWDETKDDGHYEIESEVWIGPILTPTTDEVMIKTVQAVLDENSGEVGCEVFTARTAQLALESTTPKLVYFQAGRNLTQLIKRSGHAHYLRLFSSSRWAMESIKVAFPGRAFSKTRARGR